MSITLFTTAPPHVIRSDIVEVMDKHYGGVASVTKLGGERDSNFKVLNRNGEKLILKFINAAETEEETVMQIAVLKHLETKKLRVQVPKHIPSKATGEDWVEMATNFASASVRAYSYLSGPSGTQLKVEPAVMAEFGALVADLLVALEDFKCANADRVLLWDVSQLHLLKPFVPVVEDKALRMQIDIFIRYFKESVQPQLRSLPHQVIHSDISPSNTLCNSTKNKVSAILDFGDMVYAPRVVELAVAASYQMNRYHEPIEILESMLHGFQRKIPLSLLEQQLILDLVLARLIQRIVITSWRADKFPANRDYILRSKLDAEGLFEELFKISSVAKLGVIRL